MVERLTEAEREITILHQERERWIDYTTDLQRIIEALCDRRGLPEPVSTARHHYNMAKEHLAAEALYRTGAVKMSSDDVSEIVSDLEYWSERLADMRQPQGQSTLKHVAAILSALEPAAPSDCPTCAGTGYKDKGGARAAIQRVPCPDCEPAAQEGRQEAARIGDAVLDWMVKFDLLDAGNEYYVSDVLAVLNDLTPSTHTAEQAVTDEMVEAAQDAWEEADNDTGDLDACWRAAIKAAMEAGR